MAELDVETCSGEREGVGAWMGLQMGADEMEETIGGNFLGVWIVGRGSMRISKLQSLLEITRARL